MQRMACVLVMMLGGCGLYIGGSGGGGSACHETPPSNNPVSTERDPYTGQCEAVNNQQCGACEPCVENGIDQPNWASCASACIGHDVTSCEAAAGCQAEYLDTSYWGCFPIEPQAISSPPPACSTLAVGDCTGRDDCIAVYTAVAAGSTSTKFLRCDSEAPPPPPPAACDTLTTEADCTARADCDPVYTGYDCTCDSSGCTCKTEVFASCQTR